MNRRVLVGGGLGLALSLGHAVRAQELAVPVSLAFGLSYIDFLDLNEPVGASCETQDYYTSCHTGTDYNHRLLTMATSSAPIFRISLEGYGGNDVEWLRFHALKLAPNDSYSISTETWADGSYSETLLSPWLAEQYPNDSSLWAGNEPGTWKLIVQNKFGQDKTARAILSLPDPVYSIEEVDEQVKGGDRVGQVVRAYVDPTSSLEGRVLASERILYEVQADKSQSKFVVLFAYEPGDVIDDLFSISRAAVSVDGKGFLEKAFPIMEDKEGTLQVEVLHPGEDFETSTFLLAK